MKLVSVISALFISSTAWSAGDIACRDFDDRLESAGIKSQDVYSQKNAQKLATLIEKQISEIENSIDTDNEVDDAETKLDFLKFGQNALLSDFDIQVVEASLRSKVNNYFVALRTFYSVCAMEFEGEKQSTIDRLGVGLRVLSGHRKLNYTPDFSSFVDPTIESQFLKDPSSGAILVNQEGMKDMTVEEAATLDISASHFVWHTQSYVRRARLNNVDLWDQHIENANRSVSKFLEKRQKKKLKKPKKNKNKFGIPEGEEIKLQDLGRILEFDGIKDSATSPKISARDNFNLKWKLKWGNETQVEPIVNQLWMHLGGKHTDIVFSNPPGFAGTTLILSDPQEAKGCEKIATVETFKKCMMESKYEFDVSPYILEHGMISSHVFDELADLMHETGRFNSANLTNRQFITFNTSMIEYGGKGFVEKGGPAAFSSGAATQDRVGRGLGILNAWINNIDAKDENNKAYLVTTYDDDGNKSVKYVETQHDMGNSLGRFDLGIGKRPVPGAVNKFRGDDFLHYDKAIGKLILNERTLYLPEAWNRATTADSMWMAYKLAKLPTALIRKSVAASQWPWFVQEAMVDKLQLRRLHIAKEFGVSEYMDDGAIKTEDYNSEPLIVAMTTRNDREIIERQFGISVETLEDELVKAGQLDDDNRQGDLKKTRTEFVREMDGDIAKYDESLIIGILERDQYPAGLSRRVTRQGDNKPLEFKHPKDLRPESRAKVNFGGVK